MRALPGALFVVVGLVAGCDGKKAENRSLAAGVSAAPLVVDIPLPAFALVDQHDRPFTSDTMHGSVTIVDFVFTSCQSVCPSLTRKMADLVERTAADDGIKFLSISVDPENDTPERMRAFLSKYGKDSPRWSFVTGAPDVVQATVVAGFKTRMDRDKAGTLAHGEHFVVVDKSLHVRGYFEATPDGLVALVERARALEHE